MSLEIRHFDFTSGASDDAEFALSAAMEALRSAPSLDDGRRALQDGLLDTAQECGSGDWDGYGALPVEARTLANALDVVSALPHGTPMPSPGAEPDGHLTLEWYRSPDWPLSVSISPDNTLYYAARIGASRVQGAEPFLGRFPSEILDIVDRLGLA